MRESGYYWVKILEDPTWQIAEWDCQLRAWYIMGNEKTYQDEIFTEIKEEPINAPA